MLQSERKIISFSFGAMAKVWPLWIVIWLVLSSIIVAWDIGFVLMRPASMEGGEWSWLWAPYSNYYRVDLAYGDLSNHWIRAQTLGNIFESFLNFSAVIFYYSPFSSQNRMAPIIGMCSALMTLWKTVLYWVIEYCSNYENTGHNTLFDAVFIFIIPNALWLIFPFLIVMWFAKYFYELVPASGKTIQQKQKRTKKA